MKTPTIHPPKAFLLAFALLIALLFPFRSFACSTDTGLQPKPAETNALQTLTDAGNQFGLDLYKKIVAGGKADDSQFFSPFSVFAALCMLSEGTDGGTLVAMQKALHLPEETILHEGFKALGKTLSPQGAPYALSVANAIWPELTAKVQPQFIEAIKKVYLGESKPLDFAAKSEASRLAINAWVEQKTQNRIKDLLPPGSVSAATRMVLTNAIYFKGKWKMEFNKRDTQDQPFTLDDGGTVQAPLMFLSSDAGQLNYTEQNGTQFVELPYQGEDLSMVVMLPQNGKIGNLEAQLDAKAWAEIRAKLAPEDVNVWLPRFKKNIGGMLNEPLAKTGLGAIFGDCDFSRMFGPGSSFTVSGVYHKAFVEVNEEGTEAAAATAIVVNETSASVGPDPINFRADHPFLFIIQHRATGNILFMGKVMNPVA